MTQGKLVSPQQMHDAACRMMLDGRQPETEMDWIKIVNFYAANVDPTVAIAAMPVLCMIMGCPLSKEAILHITTMQVLSSILDKAINDNLGKEINEVIL